MELPKKYILYLIIWNYTSFDAWGITFTISLMQNVDFSCTLSVFSHDLIEVSNVHTYSALWVWPVRQRRSF